MKAALRLDPRSLPARGRLAKRGRLLGVSIFLLVGSVTLIPLGYLALNSFNVAPLGRGFEWGVEGWRQAYGTPQTINALVYSFLLSIRTFIGIALAFPISWLLIRVRVPGHSFIEFSLWMAWFLPPLSIAIGWITLMDPQFGLLNQLLKGISPVLSAVSLNIYSFSGILWVHLTLLTVPIMTILLTPAFRQFDASFEESARVCGSGPLKTLRRIDLPLLLPAVFVVVIAGFIRSLEAFEVEQVIGIPAGIYVYGTRIYDLVHWDPPLYPQAMALSTIFLTVLFILVVVYQYFVGSHQASTISAHSVSFRPALIGKWKYLASACLFVLIGVGIYLPLGMLVVGSFMKFFGIFSIKAPFSTKHWLSVINDPAFLSGFRNSIFIGFAVAIMGVAVYSLLAYSLRLPRMLGRNLISGLVWIPWAIPGVLLGLALLWIFISVPGLNLFYNTFGPLIIALAIKEMPIGTQMIRSAFSQISEELVQASKIVGAGWFTTFVRIELPLIAPMLVSIFVIVFMASLRDVSTTVLLVSPSTMPLSVLMLERFMTGGKEAASVIGAILSLLAILTAWGMRKLGFRLGADSV